MSFWSTYMCEKQCFMCEAHQTKIYLHACRNIGKVMRAVKKKQRMGR